MSKINNQICYKATYQRETQYNKYHYYQEDLIWWVLMNNPDNSLYSKSGMTLIVSSIELMLASGQIATIITKMNNTNHEVSIKQAKAK